MKDALEEMLDKTELEDYQEFVATLTSKHVKDTPIEGWWAASGLSCEAAEVLELFEKGVRKNAKIDLDKLLDELSDVLWFAAACANAYKIKLDDVLMHNIDKLNKRLVDEKERFGL